MDKKVLRFLAIIVLLSTGLLVVDSLEINISETNSVLAQEPLPSPTSPNPTPQLDLDFAESRIAGGNEAPPGQWPHMVAIKIKKASSTRLCGGSLIHPEWVLSAAHCFHDNNSCQKDVLNTEVEVVLGTLDLSSSAGIVKKVAKIITHEDYNCFLGYKHDIALIHLSTPVQLGTYIQPIVLADSNDAELFAPGKTALVTGWGLTSAGSIPNKLQMLDVPILSPLLNCFRTPTLFGNIICAGYKDKGKGVCAGDSGGPLIVENAQQTGPLQVGIVSVGSKPCNQNPGIYTKVASYNHSWIEPIIGLGDVTINVDIGIKSKNSTRLDFAIAGVGRTYQTLDSSNVPVTKEGKVNITLVDPDLPPSTYELYFKPERYLAKRITRSLKAGNNIITFSQGDFKAGDLNDDNRINVRDLIQVISAWGPTSPSSSIADFNQDGNINSFDLLVILGNWGEGAHWESKLNFSNLTTLAPKNWAKLNTFPRLKNNDFELGANGNWIESSTSFSGLIYNLGITPRSGSWVARLGGGNNEVSDLSQTVAISTTGPVYLHYWYQVRSGESNCLADHATVLVNSTQVHQYELCQPNNTTNWTLGTIDIGAYTGQTVTLHFHAETSSSSEFFIDDVFFADTLEAPGRITLTPDQGTFNVGDIFDVQVRLDTGSYTTRGADVKILYDPAVLEVQDAYEDSGGDEVSRGDLYKKYYKHHFYKEAGEILISADKVEDPGDEQNGIGAPFQGNGVLATITFKVVASIPKTALIIEYEGDSLADSNIFDDATEIDILRQVVSASFQTIGLPNRPMPVLSFTPTTNSIITSTLVSLEAVARDPHEDDQIQEVKFEFGSSDTWNLIGIDRYKDDGRIRDWDTSSLPEGTYQLRTTASLLGGEGTTVINNNIVVDRTPPDHMSSSVLPTTIPGAGTLVSVNIVATDNKSGVDHIDIYAKLVDDNSNDTISWTPWDFIGQISGEAGSLTWDTTGYEKGIYQIAFEIYDKAGNSGPETQPQLLLEIKGQSNVYLPLVLKVINPTIPNCVASTTTWQNFPLPPQTGTFTAKFDVTPNHNNMDGLTGLSAGSATVPTNLAAIVRFNAQGFIDARSGSEYKAVTQVPYNAGANYRIRLVIRIPSHTYDIFVTPPNGVEQVIGTNFAFRSEQSGVTSLNHWALFANPNVSPSKHTVCNFTLSNP